MKLQDYIIELKKPSYLLPDLVSRIMLLISIAVFGYAVYVERAVNKFTIALALLTLGMVAWWIYCAIIKRRGETPYYRFGLLLATIGWVILYKAGAPIWIPALYFVGMLIERQVKFPQEIAFNEEGIVVNSIPKKEYGWNELNNVVLKDNILTIDFKNNKLIQKEIESDASRQEENEFNTFCKNRLSQSARVDSQAEA